MADDLRAHARRIATDGLTACAEDWAWEYEEIWDGLEAARLTALIKSATVIIPGQPTPVLDRLRAIARGEDWAFLTTEFAQALLAELDLDEPTTRTAKDPS